MNRFIEQIYNSFTANSANKCLIIDDLEYTYADLAYCCEQIRHQVHNCPDDNIGLYLSDDIYMYAGILAIWYEGKTYVPIHSEFPLNKNVSIIEQADINHIISPIILTDFQSCTIIDSTLHFEKAPSAPCNSAIEQNAYILFTSGSTGNPKGVPITFANLLAFSQSFELVFGKLHPEDQVLQMFDLTFDLSVMSFLMPILYGSAIVALHKDETKYLQILDLLEGDKITIALMVPSILNLIIPYLDENIKNSSLRLNLFCGEALLAKQISCWKKFVPNARLYNVYGPTENTIFCSSYEISGQPKEKNGIICIGKSIPNSTMSFEKEDEEAGELLLSGRLLSKSYWKNPAKTQEVFMEKNGEVLYRTGDWCTKDADGDFYFLHRVDFQAKINGFRIELAEIEHFANQQLDNAVSVAMLDKDQAGNDILVLFVNSEKCNESNLLQHLKNHLPEYAIPSKIVKMTEFPVNTSGKTDRKELKNLLK